MKYITIILILLNILPQILKSETGDTLKTKNENVSVKTNLMLPLLVGAELSVEIALSKNITVQLSGNFYNIKNNLFWPTDQSKCIILEPRYFFKKAFDGLYLGPYSRLKSSYLEHLGFNHDLFGKYNTLSLNYGLTVGVEQVFSNGFTINPSFSLGTGINISTKIINDNLPFYRNKLIKSTNINHVRIGLLFGKTF